TCTDEWLKTDCIKHVGVAGHVLMNGLNTDCIKHALHAFVMFASVIEIIWVMGNEMTILEKGILEIHWAVASTKTWLPSNGGDIEKNNIKGKSLLYFTYDEAQNDCLPRVGHWNMINKHFVKINITKYLFLCVFFGIIFFSFYPLIAQGQDLLVAGF
ncbi:hypothetical protein ACJX0J_030387, partial [Zea mays]